MGELILIRHGETEWSRTGRHTGRTDVPLTDAGLAAAAELAPALAGRNIVAAFTSPARRATVTAQIAGLANARQDPGLWEWDYGGYEGLTSAEIAELRQRLEIYRAAFAEGIGQHSEELAACVKAMVRDLENGLFKLVDQRFAALNARLDLFSPDKPRANDTDERDDGAASKI